MTGPPYPNQRMTMYSPNEQFASMNKASYENALRMASISLDKAERYAKFNLHAARVVLEQTAQTGSVVAGAKDAHDVETLRGKVSELVVQNATAYAKGLYQIASETQTEFSELAEKAWSTYAEE